MNGRELQIELLRDMDVIEDEWQLETTAAWILELTDMLIRRGWTK